MKLIRECYALTMKMYRYRTSMPLFGINSVMIKYCTQHHVVVPQKGHIEVFFDNLRGYQCCCYKHVV